MCCIRCIESASEMNSQEDRFYFLTFEKWELVMSHRFVYCRGTGGGTAGRIFASFATKDSHLKIKHQLNHKRVCINFGSKLCDLKKLYNFAGTSPSS
jgi:hypothetical protein